MKKSKLMLLLCAVLMLSLALTACGDKTDFLQTLKTAAEMERYEYSMTANVKIASEEEADTLMPLEEMELVLSGFNNDMANGKANLSFKVVSGGTTVEQEVCDILLIDNALYLDLSVLANLMGGDESMLPEGKTILKLEDFSDFDESVDTSANVEAVKVAGTNLLIGISDILEKSAEDVSPDVFYKDGDKYCFSLSKDNGAAFIHNLGDTLKSDFPTLFDNLVSALKNSEDEDCKLFGEELEALKDDLTLSVSSAADELLAVEDADFDGFSFLASSTLTGKEGSREWTIDLDAKVQEDNNIRLTGVRKEYTEEKELSVDQEKVITLEELLQSSGYGSTEGYDSFYDFGAVV